MAVTLASPVTELRGIGSAKAASLAKLGVKAVGDLLRLYPRAYQNRGDVHTVAEIGEACRRSQSPPPVSLELTVSSEPKLAVIRRGMSITRFKAFDETGVVEISYFNQPFMKNVFHTGAVFRFWGRVELRGGRLTMANPVQEAVTEGTPLLPIVPVYPLASGLRQKLMQSLIREALSAANTEICDHIPPSVLRRCGLCSLSYAIKNIHFPDSIQSLDSARRRMAFDEVFTVSSAMCSAKLAKKSGGAPIIKADVSPLMKLFKFELTGAQKRCVSEILGDMSSGAPMSRILCGDVGSGKTAVAALAAYAAAASGYQCALMAPTEILAKQHYAQLSPMFSALGLGCVLLCGSLTAAEKKKIQASLSSPDAPMLVIGTHALLSEGVEFRRLGLVITDEQHRFGVNQRAALRRKSQGAHNLVMSATPIPRTLSLVIYGDLDVSRLDEMPPGRQKVSTFKVDESYRRRLLGFVRKQAQEGHRTYVVCPSIEEKPKQAEDAEELYDISFLAPEEEEPPMKAAVSFAKELSEKLPDLKIGFIHGKMKTAEKDAAMASFAAGDTDVLVSTTVIEVGVDVPEATLMVVENAERFGLSQLHQLRGRVGRGKAKSWCILVSDTENESSLRRLDVMCRENDGFKVAEEDLRLRGPGDFFSRGGEFRQHGSADMRFAAEVTDTRLTEQAVECATEVCTADPRFEKEEDLALGAVVRKMLEESEDTVS